jgi:hypothetical protein
MVTEVVFPVVFIAAAMLFWHVFFGRSGPVMAIAKAAKAPPSH